MSTLEPHAIHIATLFRDPAMLDSRRTWQRNGFTVLDPAKDTECMVARHPTAPGVLFKKYTPDVSTKEQNTNYAARVEGSQQLSRFIRTESLQHVVVPRKHLHPLPTAFGVDARVLVVDHLDIFDKNATMRLYHNIAEPLLHELLRVLVRFKGLDSNAKNVTFTRDGKIAFIDLENWERTDRDKVRLKSIGDYLSKGRRKLAKQILATLTY